MHVVIWFNERGNQHTHTQLILNTNTLNTNNNEQNKSIFCLYLLNAHT